MNNNVKLLKMKVMKKSYINPSITVVSFASAMVCQVGSVHGNANLQYSGGVDSGTSDIRPL